MALDYKTDGAVAIATLSRPDKLNAFNDELGFAFLDAITKASEDESIRCIVITGEGRAFSSGEDLAALAATYESGETPPLGKTLTDRYNPVIRAIRRAQKPVLAAVNGVAAGAGASVALACDFRIASEHAKLVLAFIKVGLVPDSAAVWFLARMIGTARTFKVAALGEPISSADALDLGLFDEVVSADRFKTRWSEFASELAAGPTEAFALTKRLVAHASEHPLEEQLQEEVHAQTRAGKTDDHLEGVQAFLGKRRPTFTGH